MPTPDNKYCPECIFFEGKTYDAVKEFRKKNKGHIGCSGIPFADGEFPYDCHAHCFRDTPYPKFDDDYII